jgi:mannose-1-phosphate guanylyltransferase
MRALLLAAGLGTRLKPLTDHWPKCLMPVGKRPLLEYWLHTLKIVGIQNVLVNTHFHAAQVKTFLSRERFVSWVKSINEIELLGTAGTIQANINFFRGQTTLLIHADNWCQCDFEAFVNYHLNHRPSHCLITMMTFDTDSPQSCGIVETDCQGVVTGFHEKVAHPPGRRANAAVYLLHPEVIAWIENNPTVVDFSLEVLPQYIGRIATWHNTGIHRDIGTLSALRASQRDSIPKLIWPDDDEWQKDFESSTIFRNINNFLLPSENLDER